MTTVTEIVHFLYTMHSALCPTIDSYGHTEAGLTRCEIYMYLFGGKSSSFIYVITKQGLSHAHKANCSSPTVSTPRVHRHRHVEIPKNRLSYNKTKHFLRFRAAPYKYYQLMPMQSQYTPVTDSRRHLHSVHEGARHDKKSTQNPRCRFLGILLLLLCNLHWDGE